MKSLMMLLCICVHLLFLTQLGQVESVEELERMDPLYTGDSVDELLSLCKMVNRSSLFRVPGRKSRQCPNGTTCIKFCNEDRLDKLWDAQTRVTDMLKTLREANRVVMHFSAFFVVMILGIYLIAVKHFDWRTLPLIGHRFHEDPTDGYRYSHYTWMKWIILDSKHPAYYVKMTPDAHELEYIPQREEWNDPEAESEQDIHPAWSAKDIRNLTQDPHERLEFYFLRVQQSRLNTKQPLLFKLYNQLKAKKKEEDEKAEMERKKLKGLRKSAPAPATTPTPAAGTTPQAPPASKTAPAPTSKTTPAQVSKPAPAAAQQKTKK